LSFAEQRYRAVLEVISEGRTVKEVASQWGVSRQTLHGWLARYEAGGLEGLADRSHRTAGYAHQMPASVEAAVLELRRQRPYWGPRRIALELKRRRVEPLPSESAVYRCLVRAGVIDPDLRRRRGESFRRWERARPMELWQMDVVGGFALARLQLAVLCVVGPLQTAQRLPASYNEPFPVAPCFTRSSLSVSPGPAPSNGTKRLGREEVIQRHSRGSGARGRACRPERENPGS
jgi:transposase-like protein